MQGRESPSRAKWIGKCLYCETSFSGGQRLVRRFSDQLGVFRDHKNVPIPLEYLNKDSNRWFHEHCVYRSLKRSSHGSPEPSDVEQSSNDDKAFENSSNSADEAAQTTQLMDSPETPNNAQLSTLLRQAIDQLVPSGELQPPRTQSTRRRANTKYDHLFARLLLQN